MTRDTAVRRQTVVGCVLVLIVVLGGVTVIPGTVAATGPAGMAGSGTADDPYEVTNVTQLQAMQQDLDAHYELVNDIDASDTQNWNGGAGFLPVGDRPDWEPFTGSLDGNGHTISNLYIYRNQEGVGLFGFAAGVTIRDVHLRDADMTAYGTDDVNNPVRWAGTLIGYAYDSNPNTISGVSATGTLSGREYVGGLIGGAVDTDVTDAYTDVSVSADDSDVGGLIGDLDGVSVTRSYATGDVYAPGAAGVGGLLGMGVDTDVVDSYATGDVTGGGYVGGLIGNVGGSVETSYSTGSVSGGSDVGGLIGSNPGTATNSYWDTQTSGQSTSNAGTGLTTAEMTGTDAETNMDGFDFGSTWTTTDGYPELADPANFGVTIDNTNPTVVVGEDLVVSATIENTGDLQDTQNVVLTINGSEKATKSVTLDGGSSTSVDLTYPTVDGDTPALAVGVGSDNDSDATTATVLTPADFDVTIDGTNAPVTEGDVLTVDATVTNLGQATATKTITLADFGDAEQDSVDVSLAGGASQSVTLSWQTAPGDAGTDDVAVASPDHNATDTVWVRTPVNFAVTVTGTNSPVADGDTLTVDVNVTNLGETAGTQAVTLADFDGTQQDSVDVTLAGGQSDDSVALAWATTPADVGTDDVTVASPNATDAVGVTVTDTTDPVPDAGSDTTVDEDTQVDFDGSGSTDNVGVTGFEWDFGDGTQNATGPEPNHTFVDPGSYAVVLTVTDDAGNHASDTLTVTVEDVTDPVADAGPNRTVDEDTPVEFNGSGSADNDAVASYAWDFGDGSTNATGAEPTHSFDDPGTHVVTLQVADNAGNTDVDTLVVTVNDTTPPVVDAGANRTVDEDTTVRFNGSESADNDAITSYAWDFGDGTNATGVTANHTFADPGNYTVVLTAIDVTDNEANDSLVVTVNDTTAPVADAGNDSAIWLGQRVEFNASGSTDNDEIVAYRWDFGDGTNSTNVSESHRFGSTGGYTVTLNVTDAAGNRDSDVRNLTVRRRPSPTSPEPATEDGPRVVVDTSDGNATERSNVSVRNAEPGNPVVIAFESSNGTGDGADVGPSGDANVSLSRLTVNVSEGGDFTLNVTTYEASGDEDTDEAFRHETGAMPAGYVVVNHSVSDEVVGTVTFQFRVRKAYFERTGLDSDAVSLFRDEGANWRELDAEVVGETATHYLFEATSPGLSVFAIGSTVPVLAVTSTNLSADGLGVGESVEVTISVENRGGVAGTFDADLLVDGERVATGSVAVDAFGEATLAIDYAFDEPGTYELAVGDTVVGSVTVESAATTTAEPTATATPAATTATTDPGTTDGDGGGFQLVVVLVLLVAGGVAVFWWPTRRES